MKKFVLLSLLLASLTSLTGQGGAQINLGLVTLNNTNTAISSEGLFHSGFSIGIQSRLKDRTFVAGPGFRYTRFSITPNNNLSFFNKEENYHMFSLPFNIGLEYRLAYIFKLRLYTGGAAHYFWKIDDNRRNFNFDDVSDLFFGAHAGVGVDVSWVTFDLRYERGLSDAHKFDNSKYNWLSFAVGFFF